jgi:hypothetical protein
MSSVSIQGNASGTGIFTIASPNSNTNRTLTLPDSAGTLINTAPGTTGNVLTSNGTDWVSQAPAGGGYAGPNATVYASGSGTFTIPSGITRLKVTVIGGGGGGGNRTDGGGGGGGGAAIKWLTSVTPGNTLSYSVGAGGATNSSGSTSSVSSGTQSISTISATGGAAPAGSGGAIGCGNGGYGIAGDLNIVGNAGGYRGYNDGNSGGGSLYAGGGAGANNDGSGRQAGQQYGGGGGANNGGATGVIVFEY